MTRILLVEDEDTSRSLLKGYLEKQGYEVIEAINGMQALERVEATEPDLIILDRGMPDLDGLEVVQHLRADHNNSLLYIIMLTAKASSNEKVEGLDQGADDYLAKPCDLQELSARIRRGIRQIEERKDAIMDGLTSVYNRIRFTQLMRFEIDRFKSEGSPLSLVFIDLDHFKSINDNYGHSMGDEVLKRLGELLKKTQEQGGIPGRWGGEEFVLLLPGLDVESAKDMAEALRENIAQERFEGVDQVTASMGVAQFTSHEQDLLERADQALYKAKEEGRNRVVLG